MPISKEQQDNLEIWIEESDFKFEVDAEEGMATLIGFISDSEKEDTTTGMTHEVLADFLDWCIVNLGYESYSIEAMIRDYLKIPRGEEIRYWE